MKPVVVRIAEQFSRYPAGRYATDGPNSGERFREEFLKPILDRNEKAVVELDGTRGYGSSFLEEAFGGLVRAGFSIDRIKSTFEFRATDTSLIDEIMEYIDSGDAAE